MFVAPVPKTVETGAPANARPDPFESITEMARARKAFLPVLLYIYDSNKATAFAKACHRLNSTVFVDQEVVKRSTKFLCLAADFSKLHKTLRIQFKLNVVPTVIFTDAFANVLYTLRGSSVTPAAFQRFMDNAEKRNKAVVETYKAKLEALKKEFEKADGLIDSGKFDDAVKLLERMTGNQLDADIADGAKARLEEVKMGRLFLEGTKALEEKNFDLAKVKLDAVADSQILNRWASRAYEIAKSIPAAKLYNEALTALGDGKNYEAMQMLEKVLAMDTAGQYAALAKQKLDEIKGAWGK